MSVEKNVFNIISKQNKTIAKWRIIHLVTYHRNTFGFFCLYGSSSRLICFNSDIKSLLLIPNRYTAVSH